MDRHNMISGVDRDVVCTLMNEFTAYLTGLYNVEECRA